MELILNEDIRAMQNVCSTETASGLRCRLLITLLWSGALRLREALGIQEEDIEFDNTQVAEITFGEQGLRRVIPFSREDTRLLIMYQLKRGAMRTESGSPLICTFDGKPLSIDYIRAMLRRVSSRAGIKKQVNARSIRASRVLSIDLNQTSPEELQERLGYKEMRGLVKYVKSISARLGEFQQPTVTEDGLVSVWVRENQTYYERYMRLFH